MFGVIAEPSRPVPAVRQLGSPPQFDSAVVPSTRVVAFGLYAVCTRCRSHSPLDRTFHRHLCPGYRFSGRYVLAGSTAGRLAPADADPAAEPASDPQHDADGPRPTPELQLTGCRS